MRLRHSPGRSPWARSTSTNRRSRRSRKGWLAIGVQLASAASLPHAYLMNTALAWLGAAILVFFARDLTRKKGSAMAFYARR